MSNSQFAQLNAAYRSAKYVVFEDSGAEIVLRVGVRNQLLDELLKRRNAKNWAFITAFNPHSERLSDAENEAKQKQLIDFLIDRNYFYLRGCGASDNAETWQPETSAFILNIERETAFKIGETFDQNAILYGVLNDAPQLIWINFI